MAVPAWQSPQWLSHRCQQCGALSARTQASAQHPKPSLAACRKCTRCLLGWVFELCLPPLTAGAVTSPIWLLSWQSSVNRAGLMFALKGWAHGPSHSHLYTLLSSGDGASAQELGVRFLGYSQHCLAIRRTWGTGRLGERARTSQEGVAELRYEARSQDSWERPVIATMTSLPTYSVEDSRHLAVCLC